MSKFSLTAIPFFILAGNLMNWGGIAKRPGWILLWRYWASYPGALFRELNIGANALFGDLGVPLPRRPLRSATWWKRAKRSRATTKGAFAPPRTALPPCPAF